MSDIFHSSGYPLGSYVGVKIGPYIGHIGPFFAHFWPIFAEVELLDYLLLGNSNARNPSGTC